MTTNERIAYWLEYFNKQQEKELKTKKEKKDE